MAIERGEEGNGQQQHVEGCAGIKKQALLRAYNLHIRWYTFCGLWTVPGRHTGVLDALQRGAVGPPQAGGVVLGRRGDHGAVGAGRCSVDDGGVALQQRAAAALQRPNAERLVMRGGHHARARQQRQAPACMRQPCPHLHVPMCLAHDPATMFKGNGTLSLINWPP